MILCGTAAQQAQIGNAQIDTRLVGWQDVMPTLLTMAGLQVPDTVEGISMVGESSRSHLYGEMGEGATATRMIHDGRHKLIYYPVGNRRQLFDLEEDPQELTNLSDDPAYAGRLGELEQILVAQMYGGDTAWIAGDQLVGTDDIEWTPSPNRGLSGQRGLH